MVNMDDYLLQYKRKIPNILFFWTAILAFITCFILIINNTLRLKDYYQVTGIIEEGYLNVLVFIEDVEKVIDNDWIYIDNEKYNYEVERISEDYIQEGNKIYQNLFLQIDLKEKYFIENRVIKAKFIVKERTILEYIFYLIKGE